MQQALARYLDRHKRRLQVSLQAEAEQHASRERRELLEALEAAAGQQLAAFVHQVAAEEHQALVERKEAKCEALCR